MFWQRYVSLCNSVGKAPNVVATEIGIKSSGTVTGWKNGATPRRSVLSKLAKYFEVPVEDLLDEQKEKPAPKDGDGLDELDRRLLALMKLLTPDQKKFLLAQLLTVTGQGE